MRTLQPAYEREAEVYTADPVQPVPKAGQVAKVKKGERAVPVPLGDMNQGSEIFRADLLKMMDEGAPMSPRQYQTPPSAVEVSTEVELINQLVSSRVKALQMGLSHLCRLMIDMTVKAGQDSGEVEIGGIGRQKSFSISQLDNPKKYTISCRLMSKNKKIEIVNEARAMALWGKMPDEFIIENILMVDDPAGVIKQMNTQKARLDPAIDALDSAISLAEEAEDKEDEEEADALKLKSMIKLDTYVQIILQRQNPMAQGGAPEPAQPTSNGNGLVKLLGNGGLV